MYEAKFLAIRFLIFQSDCVTLDQIRHNWDEIVQLHSTMCDKVPSYSCMPLEGRDFLCMTCSVSL